jgi:adenylate cyclase
MSTSDREKDSFPRLRMDFVAMDVEFDDETRTIRSVLAPDPRRYDHREIDGTWGWYDRFDHTFLPDDVLADMAAQMPGTPMYFQPQEISDAEEYVHSRRGAIDLALEGKAPEPTFEDKSEAFLQSLATNKLGFVILSLDIVGSTRLSQAVAGADYARTIAAVVSELSLVIPQFHGHVLNYTGDGFIAYFAEPSFTTKNDLAIDCALTLRLLLYRAINPALEARGLPTLDIRIGLDAGQAFVVTLGDPRTKQHKDVIGEVVNLASKIQAQADPGSVVVGDTVDLNLHVGWREQLQEFDPGPGWAYNDRAGRPYRLWRVGRDDGAGPRAVPPTTPTS